MKSAPWSGQNSETTKGIIANPYICFTSWASPKKISKASLWKPKEGFEPPEFRQRSILMCQTCLAQSWLTVTSMHAGLYMHPVVCTCVPIQTGPNIGTAGWTGLVLGWGNQVNRLWLHPHQKPNLCLPVALAEHIVMCQPTKPALHSTLEWKVDLSHQWELKWWQLLRLQNPGLHQGQWCCLIAATCWCAWQLLDPRGNALKMGDI